MFLLLLSSLSPGFVVASDEEEIGLPELPNQSPIASDDAYTMDAAGTLEVPAPGVLANDADAEGDP